MGDEKEKKDWDLFMDYLFKTSEMRRIKSKAYFAKSPT